jgi:hypothetical protein
VGDVSCCRIVRALRLRGNGARGAAKRSHMVKDLHISKGASGLLRWALAQLAWRLVMVNVKWAAVFSRLRKRSGKKRSIVAIARKLLCLLYAMLQTSTPYKVTTTCLLTGTESSVRTATARPTRGWTART